MDRDSVLQRVEMGTDRETQATLNFQFYIVSHCTNHNDTNTVFLFHIFMPICYGPITTMNRTGIIVLFILMKVRL